MKFFVKPSFANEMLQFFFSFLIYHILFLSQFFILEEIIDDKELYISSILTQYTTQFLVVSIILYFGCFRKKTPYKFVNIIYPVIFYLIFLSNFPFYFVFIYATIACMSSMSSKQGFRRIFFNKMFYAMGALILGILSLIIDDDFVFTSLIALALVLIMLTKIFIKQNYETLKSINKKSLLATVMKSLLLWIPLGLTVMLPAIVIFIIVHSSINLGVAYVDKKINEVKQVSIDHYRWSNSIEKSISDRILNPVVDTMNSIKNILLVKGLFALSMLKLILLVISVHFYAISVYVFMKSFLYIFSKTLCREDISLVVQFKGEWI